MPFLSNLWNESREGLLSTWEISPKLLFRWRKHGSLMEELVGFDYVLFIVSSWPLGFPVEFQRRTHEDLSRRWWGTSFASNWWWRGHSTCGFGGFRRAFVSRWNASVELCRMTIFDRNRLMNSMRHLSRYPNHKDTLRKENILTTISPKHMPPFCSPCGRFFGPPGTSSVTSGAWCLLTRMQVGDGSVAINRWTRGQHGAFWGISFFFGVTMGKFPFLPIWSISNRRPGVLDQRPDAWPIHNHSNSRKSGKWLKDLRKKSWDNLNSSPWKHHSPPKVWNHLKLEEIWTH